jgi:hypothetical protein
MPIPNNPCSARSGQCGPPGFIVQIHVKLFSATRPVSGKNQPRSLLDKPPTILWKIRTKGMFREPEFHNIAEYKHPG